MCIDVQDSLQNENLDFRKDIQIGHRNQSQVVNYQTRSQITTVLRQACHKARLWTIPVCTLCVSEFKYLLNLTRLALASVLGPFGVHLLTSSKLKPEIPGTPNSAYL